MIYFLGARGWVRLARGEADAARADFERLGRYMEAFGMRNPALLAWRSHLAMALLALERDDEARELAREDVELARVWGAPRPIGVALRVLGMAQGGKAGIETLLESLDVLERSSAKLELGRALVELGAGLRREDGRGEARDVLRRGLDLSVRSGSQPLVDQAQRELAAAGAKPQKLVLTGLESLTPSERQVAELAAESLTEKDIAQALFVSTKSVEDHLSSVYRKLGISSRPELADALAVPV